MFASYCFSTKISVSLYQKRWQFSCDLKKVERLRIYRLKMFTSYCFSTKISLSLYQKDIQFSCHLIIGSNSKDLSPENV